MSSGGVEAMICSLANEMIKTENVSVCSIFKPKDNDVFWNKLSPNVFRLSVGKTKQGFSVVEIFKIYSIIKKGGFDIVNIHGYFYYYMLTILFLHRNVKFFYTVHSDAKMENIGWDTFFFFFKKLFFRLNWLKPITISENSRSSFTSLYGLESEMIYNGISKPYIDDNDILSPYRKTSKTKLFIHAGRISKEKNQLTLCKVFKKLIDHGHDIVLLIVGSNQSTEIFKNIETYLSDRIIYLGERNDVPQLMSCCDAMCLPSIWEGLPVTLLEAISVGCIPICSPVGGIPNVITSGENGLLSSTCSEEDYYDTMSSFLSLSDDKMNIIKNNCSKSFLDYDIKKCAKDYLNYYKK